MSEEIEVKVIKYPDRDNLVLRYTCPLTGKHKTKSAGTTNDKEARMVAGKWQAELREGRYKPSTKLTWEAFRERYETEVVPSFAVETSRVLNSVFNAVETILAPDRLAELTAERLSYFQSELRRGKNETDTIRPRSEATIRTYLAHLKSSLRWAVDVGLLHSVPKIQRPQRAKGSKIMKGRPITGEEFDRLLDKVEAALLEASAQPGKSQAKNAKCRWKPETIAKHEAKRQACAAVVVESWQHFLRGLWWSGLRLAESLQLYWDRQDRLCVDLSGKRPMLRIPAALEKGNQDRLLPVAPEFAEFLLQTPEADRKGRVFKLVDRTGQPREFQDDWVGRVVSAIGEKAGIKVNTDAKGKVKYASAHDLRRSFGERWAPRVMPQVLKELMRHESIETTLKYYVGRNAQSTADVLWAAYEQKSSAGNNVGNMGQKSAVAHEKGLPQT